MQLKELNKKISDENVQKQTTLLALEQSQAENTKMLQIVAHDLRTPISGITALADLMLDDQNRTNDDLMMLELIKTNGQNSLHLVTDLLKVHAQTEALEKETTDLYLMLKYCVEQLSFKAEAKQQKIKLQANSVIVSVSRQKMWRVVSNLIANAVKFSPTDTGIVVKMEEKSQTVLISVKDDGIGIPPDMKDRIFEMFTDAKRSGTAGEQAFGLGLAISKQIVEAHGGKIWFENNKNNGTTFFVELPKA
ncbi:MAG: HAMP domain-containing histidine kinase [Pedobacter sp.]|nr:MAG: HAMP domain-containing histidine kinase [Pedobacter sp.]